VEYKSGRRDLEEVLKSSCWQVGKYRIRYRNQARRLGDACLRWECTARQQVALAHMVNRTTSAEPKRRRTSVLAMMVRQKKLEEKWTMAHKGRKLSGSEQSGL
jgi:hypothetical protein